MVRILQLVGSATDDFYCDLSRLYAKDCIAAIAQLPDYEIQIAYVTPDQQWRFPASLSQTDLAAAAPMPLAEAIQQLASRSIDVMLPQMFCLSGMTHYRALFDLLQIPYIGNAPDVMAIAAHKARAKSIVAAAGVQVPHGEVIRRGEQPTIKPPAIVKPASADNSFGVALVRSPNEYHTALETAFAHSSEVIIEEFIELGREVRCGVIAQAGTLMALPLEEYRVEREHRPIRVHTDKLKRNDSGDLIFAAKDATQAWIVDPTDPVTQPVQAVAQQCHIALGCRHYSLFDFRIDPSGQPWFLEAGLYCSFAPKSVLAMMAQSAGIALHQLLQMMLTQLK